MLWRRRSITLGGREDLAAGVVRAIGDPALRLCRSKLLAHAVRAIRFAARFNFAIEAQTFAAMRAHAKEIHAVSAERIRDELTRMLTEGAARRAFELLDASGLLAEVLPELVKMHGVQQPPQFHPEGDVWTHTMLLLAQLPAGCSATLVVERGCCMMWASRRRSTPPAGAGDRIRFNGHVEVGVRMAEEICARATVF